MSKEISSLVARQSDSILDIQNVTTSTLETVIFPLIGLGQIPVLICVFAFWQLESNSNQAHQFFLVPSGKG